MAIHRDLDKELLTRDIALIKQSYAVPYSRSFSSVIDRIEKISSALYLVTEHLEVDEPIRVTLRHFVDRMLTGLSNLAPFRGGATLGAGEVLVTVLDGVIAGMRVARISGLISEENTLIIERELLVVHKHLVQEVVAGSGYQKTSPRRDSDRLRAQIAELLPGAGMGSATKQSVEEGAARSMVFPSSESMSISTAISGVSRVSEPETAAGGIPTTVPAGAGVVRTGISTPVGATVYVPGSATRAQMPVLRRTREDSMKDTFRRQERILEIIKDKKMATINDINLIVRDISDKSLQRILNDMVLKGVILKEGSKRWTRYYIG